MSDKTTSFQIGAFAAGNQLGEFHAATGSCAVRHQGMPAALQQDEGSRGGGVEGGAHPPHPMGTPAGADAGSCTGYQRSSQWPMG